MESNEAKKIIGMCHVVMAIISFGLSIWQIAVLRSFANETTMQPDAVYLLFRVLTLAGLLWSVALGTCAVFLVTNRARTFANSFPQRTSSSSPSARSSAGSRPTHSAPRKTAASL